MSSMHFVHLCATRILIALVTSADDTKHLVTSRNTSCKSSLLAIVFARSLSWPGIANVEEVACGPSAHLAPWLPFGPRRPACGCARARLQPELLT